MSKTVMKELIYFIESQDYNFLNKEQLESCNKIMDKAKELLPKEKQQIIDAYIEGYSAPENRGDSEQYYNLKFKDNE